MKKIGIKVVRKNNIKIIGNPNLILNKDYHIKNFMKDHRIFMMRQLLVSHLGKWKINDRDSIKTSFPKFLDIIKELEQR